MDNKIYIQNILNPIRELTAAMTTILLYFHARVNKWISCISVRRFTRDYVAVMIIAFLLYCALHHIKQTMSTSVMSHFDYNIKI